ncbi:MAG: hypothetical protein N2746_05250 [Deltaproteobacteria bacterium]|nr:hypothetical protein [Deltaproteobacteria bacterium]
MKRIFLSFLTLAYLVAISCDPNIGSDDVHTPILSTFDKERGLIILPNDLLKNPETGRLALPEASDDSELTKEIKSFMNMLDGWLVSQTITIPFEYELDKTTIRPENVLLFEIDIKNKTVTKKMASEYYVLYNFSKTPSDRPPFFITVKNKPSEKSGAMPEDFKQGYLYLVAVTSAVKTKDGKEIIENPVYYFLKKREPLLNAAKKSITILSDEEALLLEVHRRLFNELFKLVETKDKDIRSKTIAFSFFSIQSGARALFNPAIVGQILPQPNDLNGKANAPIDVKPYIYYDLPLDERTVAKGVTMMKLTGDQPIIIELAKIEVIEEKPKFKLQITPKNYLDKNSTYLVFTTNDIKSKHGVETSAYSTFSIIRANSPLITKTSDNNYVLNSPLIDNTLDALIFASKMGMLSEEANRNIALATPDDWRTAYDLFLQNLIKLEELRNAYQPLFNNIERGGIPRKNITSLWTFSTTSK